jgi:hypothetical protein
MPLATVGLRSVLGGGVSAARGRRSLDRLWKRFSKQVHWFADQFGVKVATCSDGSPVMTWANFNALNARRLGLSSPESAPEKRLVLVSDSKHAK